MSQPTRKCYATRRAAAVAPDLACSGRGPDNTARPGLEAEQCGLQITNILRCYTVMQFTCMLIPQFVFSRDIDKWIRS